jgi:hypothetical protein
MRLKHFIMLALLIANIIVWSSIIQDCHNPNTTNTKEQHYVRT